MGLEAGRRGWLRGVAQWVPGDASRGVGEAGLQPSAVLGPRGTLLCIPPALCGLWHLPEAQELATG